MSVRKVALISVVGIGIAAVGAGAVLAAFSATTSNSGNSFSAAPDFVPPSASASVIVRQNGGVAGYIRQGGSYYVYANASDTGNPASGIASVTGNVSNVTTGQTAAALASGSFTAAGQSYNRRSALLSANAALAQSTYNYTLALADNDSNSQTQSGFSVVVDNTAPSASDIQAVRAAPLNSIDPGDALVYSYSEPMDPTTILAGWNGTATAITVTITTANPGVLTTSANLGSVSLGTTAYNGATDATFDATMTMSGSNVTVTLGTQTGGRSSRSMGNATLTWTPSTAATDRAGNAVGSSSATESGASDSDF